MSTEKLSELSKPVMYSITCNGVVEEIGGDSQGFVREEVQAELDSWENGSVGIPDGYSVSALYSQEYVSALLAELKLEKQNNAGVAGMVEDYEAKLEAKDKRIAELEAKLATPVQLQNCDFESVAIMAHWCTDEQLKAWVKGVEHAKKQIRAAGFKVEGDE
ncbi:hypothetical protein [Serratia sp. (in: enterobacteria)]|uniref:hypothetical protein n=1 Tax=Serratia sp. (in: enterobacteria) TaxID=616 RepID=UPI004037DAF3